MDAARGETRSDRQPHWASRVGRWGCRPAFHEALAGRLLVAAGCRRQAANECRGRGQDFGTGIAQPGDNGLADTFRAAGHEVAKVV